MLALLYLFLAVALRVAWRDVARSAPKSGASIGRAFLVVVEGAERRVRTGDRIPIEGAASVGRDSDNQVVVDDGTVSGRHAALVYEDGRWWIEDLGSTNGTWIGNRRVTGRQLLRTGDLILVGRIALRLV